MQYVRERRDTFNVLNFLEELSEFYNEGRLSRSQVKIHIVGGAFDFIVKISKGKLTQVLDNLILNSDYWLKDDLRRDHIKESNININIQSPYIEIYDTGRGISPSIEHQLFQPFVTTKPKGEGRGLGLFIARQLLESSGCFISLLPEKNKFKRRYIFRIDLSGVLSGSN